MSARSRISSTALWRFTIRHMSNSILKLTACDGHATATVLQQWYRTQTLQSDGSLHRLETNAVQDEHWTRLSDGWKRGKIENVHGGAVFIDGKRVNVGVGLPPYDPEAPPYDPHDPRPKRPVIDTLLRIITTQGVGPAIQAYLTHGDREEAIRSYRRSLELNPQNANAVEKLRTLEKR